MTKKKEITNVARYRVGDEVFWYADGDLSDPGLITAVDEDSISVAWRSGSRATYSVVGLYAARFVKSPKTGVREYRPGSKSPGNEPVARRKKRFSPEAIVLAIYEFWKDTKLDVPLSPDALLFDDETSIRRAILDAVNALPTSPGATSREAETYREAVGSSPEFDEAVEKVVRDLTSSDPERRAAAENAAKCDVFVQREKTVPERRTAEDVLGVFIQPPKTVHLLYGGFAVCGFSRDYPRDWPSGHSWVGSLDAAIAKTATCPNCIRLDAERRGIKR